VSRSEKRRNPQKKSKYPLRGSSLLFEPELLACLKRGVPGQREDVVGKRGERRGRRQARYGQRLKGRGGKEGVSKEGERPDPQKRTSKIGKERKKAAKIPKIWNAG